MVTPMLDRPLALAASAMLLSGPAFGATLQSGPFTDVAGGAVGFSDAVSVAQFDPGLGTLEQVDWEVRSSFFSTVGMINEGFEPLPFFPWVTVIYQYTGGSPDALSPTTRSLSEEGDPFLVPAGDTASVTLSGNVTETGDATTDLSGWIGDGTVGFDANIFAAELQTDEYFSITTAFVHLSVTYSYRADVDVIPLPAAGWMLLAALVGLGGAGWLRRRLTG